MADASITSDRRYQDLKKQWDDRIAALPPATIPSINGNESMSMEGITEEEHERQRMALIIQRDAALASMEQTVETLQRGDQILAAVSAAAGNAKKEVDGMDVLMAVAVVYRAAMDNSGAKLKLLRDDLQQANANLAALTALQAEVLKNRPAGEAKDSNKAPIVAPVIDALKSYGVVLPDLGAPDKDGIYQVSQINFDKIKENINGVSSTMTTKQSTLLADLQKASNEFQERSDTSTSLVKSEKDLLSSIIRNLG